MRILAPVSLSAVFMCWSGAALASDLDKLDFLTGHWRGDISGAGIEEWWSPAAGGTKIAAFRWVTGDETNVIELVVISEEEEGVILRFKHFNPDYSTWEAGEPNTYRLVSAKESHAEFKRLSPNQDVPDVLIYDRSGDDLTFRGTDNPDVASHPDDLVLAFEKVR